MELKDIKCGDILVVTFKKENWHFPRNYIVFIASGEKVYLDCGGYCIPNIVFISLIGKFEVERDSIGFQEECCTLSRPSIAQYNEMKEALNDHGYRYNRKLKKIERLF